MRKFEFAFDSHFFKLFLNRKPDFSKNNKFHKDKNSNRISIGKFGKIINLIKEKNEIIYTVHNYET